MSPINQVIRHVPVRLSKQYPVNVKVPEEYVKLIDESLKPGGLLRAKGFEGRAEVVRSAVFDYLVLNGIRPTLDPKSVGRRER